MPAKGSQPDVMNSFLYLSHESRRRIIEACYNYFDSKLSAQAVIRAAFLSVAPVSRDTVGWGTFYPKFRQVMQPFSSSFTELKRGEFPDKATYLRYIACQSDRMDSDLATHLLFYISCLIEEDANIMKRRTFKSAIENNNIFERFISSVKNNNIDILTQLNTDLDLQQTTNRAIQIVGNESLNSDIYTNLFPDVELGGSETSYYACYRYSTVRRDIVKSFLIVRTPAVKNENCFGFTHIYKSKSRNFTRISRGTAVQFDKNTLYLLGFSKSEGAPVGSSSVVDGLKIIAVDLNKTRTTEAFLSYQAVPALYMSNARSRQPIVGRLALVHIGFESVVGRLTHEQIEPGVIAEEDLNNSLLKDCSYNKSSHGDDYINTLRAFVGNSIANSYWSLRTEHSMGDEEAIRKFSRLSKYALEAEDLSPPRD